MGYGNSPSSRGTREQARHGKQKKYEETALVLDIVEGEISERSDKYRGKSIVQVIGTRYFTLLELIPEKDVTLNLMDEIVLGKDERSIVQTIIGRIPYKKLSKVAEAQIEDAIEKIIDEKEEIFIEWLNNAPPISIRLHSLQVIKGIGPKAMEAVIKNRKIEKFKSYEDFEERTGVRDIKELIKNRVLQEIMSDDERYHLFTRPPPKDEPTRHSRFSRTRRRY